MNVGEELVSAYLQQILGCDFTQQNLYTIDSQGEIDVVGLNLKDRSVYIVSVLARHLEAAGVDGEDGVHQQMRWTPWNTSSAHHDGRTVRA